MTQPGAMKIVTLNLRHGGGTRIEKLVEYLIGTGADAIICTEFRPASEAGARLRSALADAGYGGFHVSQTVKSDRANAVHEPESGKPVNRVAVATRRKSAGIKLKTAPVDAPCIVGCELGGIAILGVHFTGLKDKASLFDYLLAGWPDYDGEKLIIGDFNTGRHYIDEAGTVFDCEDRFRRLGSVGYVDLWRRQHGEEAREYTWKAPQATGGYFRLDHAFGSPALAKRVTSCDYDHATREQDATGFRLTDHSAMTVEIAPPQA